MNLYMGEWTIWVFLGVDVIHRGKSRRCRLVLEDCFEKDVLLSTRLNSNIYIAE